MKIEDQVCTLEQAKKLKELGVNQTSHFAWIDEGQLISRDKNVKELQLLAIATDFTSAFTVAELGVMCRDCISGHCANTAANYYATPDEYARYDLDASVEGIEPLPDPLPWYVERDTQAKALADLLIWLLESNLITEEEVSQRLSNEQ